MIKKMEKYTQTLENKIKVVSDFLDGHESVKERYEIYTQMRIEICKEYGFNEVDLLSKILTYRRSTQIKNPLTLK